MPAPPSPEEILAQAVRDDDPKLIERWWNAGGDMVECIRLMQTRADECPRVRAFMRACGLDRVYKVGEGS